ncbi:MAG: porin [Gemmatimonadota bacterium]
MQATPWYRRVVAVTALLVLVARVGAAQTPDSLPARAPADTTPKITFGAFIDGYYAWDANRPGNFDRAYTTQPARHAEFNVNLAFAEARLVAPRYRGHFALQFGTSVQSNYAGEPRLGAISGPSVSQFVQEANVGVRLARTLWVDGGIFLSHIGSESWISRDNLTYTRSLIADYSPYYEAGVKLTWSASSAVTAQLLMLNGWQNISRYNTPPAVGIRLDWTASPALTLSYDDFLGNVAADGEPSRLRFYHDFITVLNPSSRWSVIGTFSVGTQSRSDSTGGTAGWYGAAVFAKYRLRPNVSIVGRLERYSDPQQVIVKTGLTDPFKTNGASLGVDVSPAPGLLWRSEARGFRSSAPVWPKRRAGDYGRDDSFFVMSLALTL